MKNKNKNLFDLDLGTTKVLPLDILLSTKVKSSDALKIIVGKSHFHQTGFYQLEPFYKHIRLYNDI